MPTAPRPRTTRTPAPSHGSSAFALHRVSFAAEYRDAVFEYFLAEQRAGRTPNPDVLCNREIKFGVALRLRAAARRAVLRDRAITRASCTRTRRPAAAQGDAMRRKDQTYFLHAVARGDFAPALMPLGALQKSEVRARARRAGPAGLRQARQHRHLLHRRAAVPRFPRRGSSAMRRVRSKRPRATRSARIVGLAFYTLGQREGLAHRRPPRRPEAAVVRRRQGHARATRWWSCRGTIIRCFASARVEDWAAALAG